jgi:hypothetical protein
LQQRRYRSRSLAAPPPLVAASALQQGRRRSRCLAAPPLLVAASALLHHRRWARRFAAPPIATSVSRSIRLAALPLPVAPVCSTTGRTIRETQHPTCCTVIAGRVGLQHHRSHHSRVAASTVGCQCSGHGCSIIDQLMYQRWLAFAARAPTACSSQPTAAC